MTETLGKVELKRRLDQATRLMNEAGDQETKSHITELVRELERLIEIAANREAAESK